MRIFLTLVIMIVTFSVFAEDQVAQTNTDTTTGTGGCTSLVNSNSTSAPVCQTTTNTSTGVPGCAAQTSEQQTTGNSDASAVKKN